ncbi:polysaccharide biosynthesis tyrosine autokinase [Porifericola rhodea]|uniref:GumC family protein n=1 Tax=Porifericola rhodea TaxID=930972 RepID=UPI0026670A29|nr:tyrosine-protein kinase family protein [Porifericola rhodea]WKN32533.1 polysaccharide biosynthesis tyrosine autokinase [Porifericola rhodea]
MKRNLLEDNLNFKVIIQSCVNKWYYFVISLIVTTTFALVYLKTTSPVYEVVASVKLSDRQSQPKLEAETAALASLGGTPEVDDEIGLLSSFFMVEKAISQLDFTTSYFHERSFFGIDHSEELYNRIGVYLDFANVQPINVPIYLTRIDEQQLQVRIDADDVQLYNMLDDKMEEEVLEELELLKVININDTLESQFVKFVVDSKSISHMDVGENYYFIIRTKDDVIKHYYENLEVVKLTEDSNIIEVSTSGSVIEKEIDFINTLIKSYIDFDLATKNQYGVKTIQFIDNQLSVVSDSLKTAESNLQEYRTTNNVVDIGMQSERLTKRLSDLEVQEEKLRIQYEYYKNMAQYLSNDPSFDNVIAPASVGIDDPLLSNLIIELSQLNREKVSIEYSSNTNNPVLKVINRKIDNAREALKENVDNQIKSTQLALSEVKRNIQTIERQFNKLPQSERNLVDIQRKFTLNNNVYNYLLQKKAEAGIAIAANVSDKMLIDEARKISDKPVSPNPLKALFLAVFSGLFFPLGFILIKDMFNENVSSVEDLQRVANVPVLEVIPLEKKKNKKQFISKDPVISESFKFARLHLTRFFEGNEGKIIGVTSSEEGEGKTYCTAHLGTSFALSGRKTLIVSSDLHRPKLNNYFNVKPVPGISDYLADKANLQEVIQKTQIADLEMLSPGSVNYTDPSGLLESKKFHDLLNSLKHKYQYIIIDTPPIGYIADYLFMEPLFDVNILIARQKLTSISVYQSTVKMLEKREVKNLYVIYNGVGTSTDNDYGYRKNITSYHKV